MLLRNMAAVFKSTQNSWPLPFSARAIAWIAIFKCGVDEHAPLLIGLFRTVLITSPKKI